MCNTVRQKRGMNTPWFIILYVHCMRGRKLPITFDFGQVEEPGGPGSGTTATCELALWAMVRRFHERRVLAQDEGAQPVEEPQIS